MDGAASTVITTKAVRLGGDSDSGSSSGAEAGRYRFGTRLAVGIRALHLRTCRARCEAEGEPLFGWTLCVIVSGSGCLMRNVARDHKDDSNPARR